MKYLTLTILTLSALFVCFSSNIYGDIAANPNAEMNAPTEKDVTGKKIPSFKLKNTSDDEILYENLRDKKLVIFLFSSKCPYSINSAKYFNELLKDNANIKLIAICLDGEIGKAAEGGKTAKQAAKDFAKKYLKDVKNAEILLADNNFRNDYLRFFGVTSLQATPVHLFVDDEARCETYIKGSTDKDDLKAAIKKLTE